MQKARLDKEAIAELPDVRYFFSEINKVCPLGQQADCFKSKSKSNVAAEWSKALAASANPQGRGFEPHSWPRLAFFNFVKHVGKLTAKTECEGRLTVPPSGKGTHTHTAPDRREINTLLLASPTTKLVALFDLCVSSLRKSHANLLCIVPIVTDDLMTDRWPPPPPQPRPPQTLDHTSENIHMDTLGIERRASSKLSGCDTSTPCADCMCMHFAKPKDDSCGVRTHALSEWRLEPPP